MPKATRQSISVAASHAPLAADLVVITGTSGSGKQTALKAFEDLGLLRGGQPPHRASCEIRRSHA